MSRKLTANVLVLHPDTDEPEVLLAGSEVPEWASDQVGDHVLEGDSHKDEDNKKSAGSPPPLQGSGSSKAKWADYAESNGVEVHDGMSRDDIVGACRSAGVPVE
jgi:hypothetical protein